MVDKIISNIKLELKKRNKTIESLCKDMNVNRNYISQLRDNTPIAKLHNISNYIGCSISELLSGV